MNQIAQIADFGKFSKCLMLAIVCQKIEIAELCKGLHRVDLSENFQTHIYFQNLASIQPRTSRLKFADTNTNLADLGRVLVRRRRDLRHLHALHRGHGVLALRRVERELPLLDESNRRI